MAERWGDAVRKEKGFGIATSTFARHVRVNEKRCQAPGGRVVVDRITSVGKGGEGRRGVRSFMGGVMVTVWPVRDLEGPSWFRGSGFHSLTYSPPVIESGGTIERSIIPLNSQSGSKL